MTTLIVSCAALAAALVALGFTVANTRRAAANARRAEASARESTMWADRAEAARDSMRAGGVLARYGPVDDQGVLLNPSDFGLVAGEKIRASYVRDHPEYPWPEWARRQAAENQP